MKLRRRGRRDAGLFVLSAQIRMGDVRGRARAKTRWTGCWYGERSEWKTRWGREQNTQFSADDIDGGAVRGGGGEYRTERGECKKRVFLFAFWGVFDTQADV